MLASIPAHPGANPARHRILTTQDKMTGPILSAQMRLSEVSDWLSRLNEKQFTMYGGVVDFWTTGPAHCSIHLHLPSRDHALRFARDHLAHGKEHIENPTVAGQTLYMVELPSFRVTLFYPTP